jgi:capsule biosynthesis phosphatase
MRIIKMKTYVIDIDGTICYKDNHEDGDYGLCHPFEDRIEKINKLYDRGNTIVYFTARGMGRHKGNAFRAYTDFYAITEKQLQKWGAKYHELILGKPSGDFYIDDRGIRANDFFDDETC